MNAIAGPGLNPIMSHSLPSRALAPAGAHVETPSVAVPSDSFALSAGIPAPAPAPAPVSPPAPVASKVVASVPAAPPSPVTIGMLSDDGLATESAGPSPFGVLERPMGPSDLAALELTPEKVKAHNILFLLLPEQAQGYFDQLMGDKHVHLATAGYSAPPQGYEEPTRRFLDELSEKLGDDVGFVTSPTADKGSIDAITSEVGQGRSLPIGYVTADSYLTYVNPDHFPPSIDKELFAAAPKFSMPDGAEYSRGTAVLSNASLVTGGRNAAVTDFMNAMRSGNKAVVLTNPDIVNPAWDPAKNRVDNASAYLAALAGGKTEGIPMDHPFNQEVGRFFADHQGAVGRNLLLVDASDPQASQKAAAFLKS